MQGWATNPTCRARALRQSVQSRPCTPVARTSVVYTPKIYHAILGKLFKNIFHNSFLIISDLYCSIFNFLFNFSGWHRHCWVSGGAGMSHFAIVTPSHTHLVVLHLGRFSTLILYCTLAKIILSIDFMSVSLNVSHNFHHQA